MEVDYVGVHRTHCCDKCGCRYGDAACPVASGKVKPQYTCEDCENDWLDLIKRLKALPPEELASILAEVQNADTVEPLIRLRNSMIVLGITGDSLLSRIREDLERGLVVEARGHLNFVDVIVHSNVPANRREC